MVGPGGVVLAGVDVVIGRSAGTVCPAAVCVCKPCLPHGWSMGNGCSVLTRCG